MVIFSWKWQMLLLLLWLRMLFYGFATRLLHGQDRGQNVQKAMQKFVYFLLYSFFFHSFELVRCLFKCKRFSIFRPHLIPLKFMQRNKINHKNKAIIFVILQVIYCSHVASNFTLSFRLVKFYSFSLAKST